VNLREVEDSAAQFKQAYGAPIADEPDIEMAPGWWGD
jgi:hypothetical protein